MLLLFGLLLDVVVGTALGFRYPACCGMEASYIQQV
jgi:hypothetical protein